MKIKVFGWLLMSDRLNSRNMLKWRHYNIGDDYTCLLCDSKLEETVEHLFFQCSLPGIVLWFSLFLMVVVVGPRGGAGPVSVEHCPSARSVALFAATWLGSGMPFDGGCDFLALQGAERLQGRW